MTTRDFRIGTFRLQHVTVEKTGRSTGITELGLYPRGYVDTEQRNILEGKKHQLDIKNIYI